MKTKKLLKSIIGTLIIIEILICVVAITKNNNIQKLAQEIQTMLAESTIIEFNEGVGENLTATLNTETGELTIKGTGEMKSYSSNTYSIPWASYKEQIKTITIEEGVTSIGEYAFEYCSSLTRIEIPEGVTSIGEYAFEYCSSLTRINVNENNTKYSSVDGVLFNKEKTEIIKYPQGRTGTIYKIPEGVTSIGKYAFLRCSSLISIEIPEGVTSIGRSAFEYCSSLTSIEIPEGVTSIGHDAFYNCSSLTSIEIPEGVTSIGGDVFAYCSSLTSIEIPAGVTSIGGLAFAYCSSLTSIEIPEGVTSIGRDAFYMCSCLTSSSRSNMYKNRKNRRKTLLKM